MKYLVSILLLINYTCLIQAQVKSVYPGASWQHMEPAKAGMNNDLLDTLVKVLEGRGCIIKNGYIIKEWGNQSETADWLSAVKPVFSTFLFFAVENDKIPNVHYKIGRLGWQLSYKDKGMEFYHLANMTSGYARPDKPGEAWAYNDYGIQLYQKSLFDSLFKQSADQVLKTYLSPLQFEDKIRFREDKPRIYASARDFGRIGLFWMNHGAWNGQQLLPSKYFKKYMKPQVPKKLPHTKQGIKQNDDYLGIGTFGGGSDHFIEHGPGIYGFNWWFNNTGRMHPQSLTWPDATPKTCMAIGAGGNVLAMIPEHNLILVSAQGSWGKFIPGDVKNRFNRYIKLLLSSLNN